MEKLSDKHPERETFAWILEEVFGIDHKKTSGRNSERISSRISGKTSESHHKGAAGRIQEGTLIGTIVGTPIETRSVIFRKELSGENNRKTSREFTATPRRIASGAFREILDETADISEEALMGMLEEFSMESLDEFKVNS